MPTPHVGSFSHFSFQVQRCRDTGASVGVDGRGHLRDEKRIGDSGAQLPPSTVAQPERKLLNQLDSDHALLHCLQAHARCLEL
eukprot:1977300-Rhodomonas_salina.4